MLTMDSAGRLATLEPGTLFAGYRIEGMLDRGGMGVVYQRGRRSSSTGRSR